MATAVQHPRTDSVPPPDRPAVEHPAGLTLGVPDPVSWGDRLALRIWLACFALMWLLIASNWLAGLLNR